MAITSKKEWLYFNFHNDIEYSFWIHINMISFSFLYWFLKTKYWNKIGKKILTAGGDVWLWQCQLVHAGEGIFVSNRESLYRTGLFCVEPFILLSNRDFLCRTSAIILDNFDNVFWMRKLWFYQIIVNCVEVKPPFTWAFATWGYCVAVLRSSYYST